MATFLLEIVTPERIAFSEQVEMVTAASSTGMIGVLAHHVPLFTRLIEGEVKITKDDRELYLAIGGGFMEVTHEKVQILVTSAYHADEINEKEVLEAQKRARETLLAKPAGEELKQALAIFRRSTIALKVVRRRGNVKSL